MLKASFGYFDKDGTEFVITEYDTPLPLINYYWNENFISAANQQMTGLGAFTERPMQYMHPECRCNIVRNEDRHFYLRDDETGEFWSPVFYPVCRREPDSFEARHGLGYSTLDSSVNGIRTRMRVFVPEVLATEIWSISLTNESDKPRKIKFYSFIDLLLTGYEEYCDYHSALWGSYDESKFAVTCINRAPECPHDRFGAFVASDTKPTGFDTSRRAFLGNMGTVAVPQAIVLGKMSNSKVCCEKMIGALENTFTIAPGETVSFNVAIGSSDCSETTADIVSKALADGAPDRLFEAMQANLARKYSAVLVKTPDERLNYLFNGWIKRAIQLHTEVGTDTGKGFRDVMQAAWAVSSYDPEGAREKIITSLKAQFADGQTLRGWDPPDYHHYSDGPVWIAPALDSYLKETGDYAFLDTVVPYFDQGEASVWGHTLTAIRHATDDLGEHGLVRMHYGDWNDSLNMIGTGGKGESVWTSIAMVFCINCALEIVSNVFKDKELIEELIERKVKLEKAIQENGWDGNWYLEAINDSGEPVGSHTEEEGKAYLSPQAFAILSGIAGDERREKVIKTIDEVLECDYGSLGLTPGYTKPNTNIGRITFFQAGMWENAAPYCHGTSFKIMADTYIGRGDRAYESMMKVLPDNPKNPCTHSGCPPYQVTNMYYGPEHPRAGQILYSWITGTSDWLFKALTSHMIGVRADYNGLLIDPCLPSHWQHVELQRSFRGARYRVTIHNPDGRETGVDSITLDGQPVEGCMLPIDEAGDSHEVVVQMKSADS
ncbi:MAG TPA: hypothetical protein VM123_20850 [archaeon]|nr:hypothetical protein [archaeon]